MFATIILVLFVLIALGLLVGSFGFSKVPPHEDEWSARTMARVWGGGFLFVTFVLALTFSLYNQSVGAAKVIINSGGTVAGYDDTAGWAVKAPWQGINNWDLFSQDLTYAGNKKDGTPQYTGGEVNGYEVTAAVARGAQVNLDIKITYALDGNRVEGLYREFRSQERFTRQVIEPKVLSSIRDIPPSYDPIEFRGAKREEARQAMQDRMNEVLRDKYGVEVTNVAIQSIRYSDAVEDSIKAVEIAQQKEAEAQANLRATQVSSQAQVVEAEAAADALRAQAQGQADANALLAASLSPQVLQQHYIDALNKGTVYVVPDGATPFIGTK